MPRLQGWRDRDRLGNAGRNVTAADAMQCSALKIVLPPDRRDV